MFAVSDDDGVTEDWFWNFGIVFRAFLVGKEDEVRLLQVGSVYIASFNQSGDTLCLRPVSVCV